MGACRARLRAFRVGLLWEKSIERFPTLGGLFWEYVLQGSEYIGIYFGALYLRFRGRLGSGSFSPACGITSFLSAESGDLSNWASLPSQCKQQLKSHARNSSPVNFD